MQRRHFLEAGVGALGLALASSPASAQRARRMTMRIALTSVFVEDQAHALDFYTNVLGFEKKSDIPLGASRWLTVVSPLEPDGTELLLEPNENEVASTFQRAIFAQGIPATAFAVDDVHQEYEALNGRGVTFTTEPTSTGTETIAVFDDTCGNLIQIYQARR